MLLRTVSSLLLATALLGSALSVGSIALARDATPVAAGEPAIVAAFTFPDISLGQWQNAALPEHPVADDHGLLLGGVGSDLWQGPDDADDEFWLVTDRGPNGEIEVDGDDRRTFPVPEFTPLILHARATDGALTILEAIPVVNRDGAPVTGLPNLPGSDETPFDAAASAALAYNPDGLDVEGLVRADDGTFWLADEYRPSLVKVAASGEVLTRYVPRGVHLPGAGYPVMDTLPAIYASRQRNRGFEGLALSSDGQTAYALLQSPLANPDEDAGEDARAGRILAIDTASGEPVAEYVYPFEAAAQFDPELGDNDQDEMKLSALASLDAQTLLVLERSDDVARLYSVDLSCATDILGSEWDDAATSPSLEDVDDLETAGVTPLEKALLVDLTALPGLPAKLEGIAVVDEGTIAVINDNDFDIGDIDEAGRNVGEGKKSSLLEIAAPLP